MFMLRIAPLGHLSCCARSSLLLCCGSSLYGCLSRLLCLLSSGFANALATLLGSRCLGVGLCLCGFLIVAGKDQTIATTSAGGRGFTAIVVAWLSKLNTFVMAFVSYALVFMQKGASQIASQFNLNENVSEIVTGIILFFVLGCEFFINFSVKLRGRRKAD